MTRTAVLLALILATAVSARVPSRKAAPARDPGARGDITVPYTTNGATTLGVYHGVAPKVLASPQLNTPAGPRMQNVYNLIFYGARLGSSTPANAATPREPNNLRGNQLRPNR